ncbi:hypothetical protein NNJEOMEG_01836 [Fundidesulfovibrio magnetotacticus]|uniref:Nitroreductase domain-containing protein n=1 Tax=Fundidesulfovibrio magnetotacticus TaxID=2730080 RepID=A0A6V8LUK4_9BACT|nr:nitroreductase family protein [Fundidesulfovibrio magnetotacticus]GFK93998.1 hypothetical protein NNJEOMEG_01836 [Fundidesulfovibrio magnetotacticus]
MKRRGFIAAAGTLALGLGAAPALAQQGGAALPAPALAQQGGAALPAPALPGGKTLEAALRARQSVREYADKDIAPDILAGILWAACGVNRPDSGRRTAPSAHNRQEVSVWAAKADGLFLYDPKANALVRKAGGDLRALTGTQSFAAKAPLNLVYVADVEKAAGKTDEEKLNYAWADTGFVSQNVYLYCAAMGLGTVVRASVDREALAKAMGLGATQRVIMAQSVGWPKG